MDKIPQAVDIIKQCFKKIPIEIGPGLWQDIESQARFQGPTYKLGIRPPCDISKARNDFGYEPLYPIEKGIPDYIRWLEKREY